MDDHKEDARVALVSLSAQRCLEKDPELLFRDAPSPSLPTHLFHPGYDKGFEKPFPKLYLNGRQWTSRFLELSIYLPFKISLNSLSSHTQSFVLPPHFPLVSLWVHGTLIFSFLLLERALLPWLYVLQTEP